jgi:uncharacterized protein with von Willebrand factor type A (vWA) domain
MTSFLDRVKNSMTGKGPWAAPKKPKEKSATTVKTNRFDEQVWTTVRKTETIDKMIYDLNIGDQHRDGERPPFEGAPELVHDLFFTFYKAAAEVFGKNEVTKESYAVRHLIEEIMANPRLEELQPMTAGDPVMSTIAVSALSDTVREIISRIPPPPPEQPIPKTKKKKVHVEYTDEDQPENDGPPPPPGQEPPDEITVNPNQKQDRSKPQTPPPPSEWEVEYDKPIPPNSSDDQGEGNEGGQGPVKGDNSNPEDIEPKEDGDPADGEAEGEAEGEPEEGEGEPDESEGEGDFDPDAEAEAAAQAELDWQDMFDNLLNDLDLDRLTNKALQEVEADVADLDGLRRGIGLEDGEWRTMSPERRLQMAEKLRSPRMKILSDIVGRMKRFALGVRATRINDVPHEIYNVELGNDIRRVLKSEFSLLADERASYEFYRRYASRELMQAKMRGSEFVGKGPIVIAVDKSGSMSIGNGITPFDWAMGVCEALRRFAADEKRDLHVIFFGNNNDRTRFEFPGGEADFEKVLAFLSCVANGGTQFDGVLTEALQRASTAFDGEAKGKADIIFITDGQAPLTPEWIKGFNDERERVGVRCYSVYIGGANDMRYERGPVAQLQKISDIVIPVSDLRPEAATAIFERV